jgi:hypothetical protein
VSFSLMNLRVWKADGKSGHQVVSQTSAIGLFPRR